MDFSWSKEQKELLDAVHRFAARELAYDVIQADRAGQFSRDAWKKCGDFGIQGLPVPIEYGGRGLDPVTLAGALEKLGYACRDNGLLFSINAHLWTVVMPLITAGTEEQKRRFLPGLANGTLIGGNAMTEPGSGSDAFALGTTAKRVGSKYLLNGVKSFVSNGTVADVVTVYANVGPGKGVQGITVFLVEKGFPGLAIARSVEKMGLRTAPTAELTLTDCEVPAENRLGEEGTGAVLFTRSMTWERGFILASAVGTMQRLLETCVRFACTRRQGGHAIGKFQHVSTKIVDIKLRLDTSRQLLYHGAWTRQLGRAGFLEAALVKLHISDSWVKTCEDAIQIHGGRGYLVEYELERELRDALGSKLYSGTSEIQKNLIASMLGL